MPPEFTDATGRDDTDLAPARISTVLEDLIRSASAPDFEVLTLGELLAALSQGSFGALMLGMALPAILMPPGPAALLGAPLLVIATQMLLGRPSPRLPRPMARLGVRNPHALALLERSMRAVTRLEAIVRPRASWMLRPWHLRLVAVACMALSAVLITPIPIAHTAAALGMVTFAAGLAQRDGVALLCG